MWVASWRGNHKLAAGATVHDTEAEAEQVAARTVKKLGWVPGMPAPEVVVYWMPDVEETA
jgi:hypothetical protein